MTPRHSPLGLALRRLRDAHGCSQRQLAEYLGRRQDWLSRVETGRGYASEGEIEKLAGFFALEGAEADALTLAWRQSAIGAGAAA